MKDGVRLALGLVFLCLIVVSMAMYLAMPLWFGTSMILATRPVDPFDVFRGQYISISYNLSSLPLIEGAQEGQGVYVSVAPDSHGIWQYESASLSQPESDKFILGQIRSIERGRMDVMYGIEQYFFERGAQFSTVNMTVEVKVDSGGQARIHQLLVNNKSVEMEYRDGGIAK